MTSEQNSQEKQGILTVGQVHIEVPGLKPDTLDNKGRVIKPGNLSERVDVIHKTFFEKPWLRGLMSSVRNEEKSAVFYITAGGIVIFVAGVAGFEFGVRHAKDLGILPKLLKRGKKKT